VGNLSGNGRTLSVPRAQAGDVTDPQPPRSHGHAPTPLGRVLIVIGAGELVGLHFDGHARTPDVSRLEAASDQSLRSVRTQLDEYFRGVRMRFDLPIRLEGTPFQQAVWAALLDIPYGRTSTYSHVAAAIGRPRAVRAVGAANGQNPISIVVPCHRLIGADGGLTGYGWGLDRKRSLLDLEAANAGLGENADPDSLTVRRERAGA
jgi:methylated-DNA-[protein]-cysteine S-methyltransferase